MVENKIAVDRNHAALKHILASLVAMAGWTATGGTFLRARGDAGSAATLPRHLYVAILRLLRPAEAATRRLVIVLSRGIVVTLPPLRPTKPKPGPVFLKDGKGTGIVDTGISLYRLGLANVAPPPIVQKRAAAATRPLAFPLLDPLRNPFPRRPPPRRSSKPSTAVPRCLHDLTGRHAVRVRLPSPHDPIDATRLGQRLAALASALDDMPAQALRFARWRAHRDRMRGQPPSPAGFAASGRCGRAARPAAVCPATIQSPGGRAESARSTRFWPMPMRWPSTRWRTHAPDTPTLHDRLMVHHDRHIMTAPSSNARPLAACRIAARRPKVGRSRSACQLGLPGASPPCVTHTG